MYTPPTDEAAAARGCCARHAQTAAKGGSPLLPRTRLLGATAAERHDFGCAAAVPMSAREFASAGLGFLGWRTVDGLRTGFDASTLDGAYMPSPVGGSPPAVEVPPPPADASDGISCRLEIYAIYKSIHKYMSALIYNA